ncbi:coiled-coil domain-containing protein 22 homolog [Watersipora subatra]|uniref:coiled-coil domain-containing protein 22 homolog n=1 Tax=Watersipora subatra TaxID=2589382 RepID=UPI00355B441B
MDEVDRIILLSLKFIGCDVEDGGEGLARFDADMIYDAVLRCVEAIKMRNCDLPRKLPPGMSQKFRAGSSLATLVTELGYKGEVGYQTFLYSNEAGIRNVLMFLVDKLPRDGSGGAESAAVSGDGQFRALIKSKIKSELKKAWLPSVCCQTQMTSQKFKGHELLSAALYGDGNQKLTKDAKKYYQASLLEVGRQIPNTAALCSALIENNALQLVSDQNLQWRLHAARQTKSKSERMEEIYEKLTEERESNMKQEVERTLAQHSVSRFAQLERLQHTTSTSNSHSSGTGARKTEHDSVTTAVAEKIDDPKVTVVEAVSEEEMHTRQEEELENLKSELQEVATRISKLTKNIDKAKNAKEMKSTEITKKKAALEESKKVYQVKKKTLDVLPESEQTIAKVQQVLAGADSKMQSLEAQWLNHKVPLVKQIEELGTQAKSRQQMIEQKLAELQTFRQQMKSSSEETRVKDEQLKTLNAELAGMSRDVSRSSYTKRIIEIVGNIKKQKHDIDKVLQDTKAVQKDINLLTGKLDRTFTVTDELIFKDAKKDESVRAAYKYLASLHESCNSVRSTIEETGVILREIRQLEDQIAQESRNEVSSTLDKIIDDYKQMKRENQLLMSKLRE